MSWTLTREFEWKVWANASTHLLDDSGPFIGNGGDMPFTSPVSHTHGSAIMNFSPAGHDSILIRTPVIAACMGVCDIAFAGGLNVMLHGSPGCGKTAMCVCVPRC